MSAYTKWNENPYFDRNEFKCTCGGRGCNGFPVEPAERLVLNATETRIHFGRAAIPSSGVRCSLRNAELPGSAVNSLHMRGKALDFCIRGVSSNELLAYVKTLPEVDEAYAIEESYVHMGVQKYKADVSEPVEKPVETVEKVTSVALPVLKHGDEGDTVRAMQGLLIEWGYGCGAWGSDGDFGDDTTASVLDFQREHDLKPDGVCGNETWCALLGV